MPQPRPWLAWVHRKAAVDPSCAPGPLLRAGRPSQGQGHGHGHPSSFLQKGWPQPASQLPLSVPTVESPGGGPMTPTVPLPHSCPSCLQNHVNLVHRKGKTKVCPHPGCGKKFYLSNHLRRHMIIHSGQAQGGAGSAGHRVMGLGSRPGAGGLKTPREHWVHRHRTAPAPRTATQGC